MCWLTQRRQHVQVLVQMEADSNLFTYVSIVSIEVIVTTRKSKIGDLNRHMDFIWHKIGVAQGGAIIRVGLK